MRTQSMFSFGIRADHVTMPLDKNLKIPRPDQQGRLLTLNQTGFMKVNLDPISKAFIDSAKKSSLPVLEIGAAYGAASTEVLKSGATVIANDIDMRHLMLLKDQSPEYQHERLYLNNQHFPTTTDFPENSINHILCCRVAHFLTPSEMDMALDKIAGWLAPEGKLFFIIVSPYHHRLAAFLPFYEKQLTEHKKWPGVIDHVKQYWPEFSENIPDMIHVMDENVLIPELTKRGFSIEKSLLFDYGPASKEQGRDGREYFGLIARKQKNE